MRDSAPAILAGCKASPHRRDTPLAPTPFGRERNGRLGRLDQKQSNIVGCALAQQRDTRVESGCNAAPAGGGHRNRWAEAHSTCYLLTTKRPTKLFREHDDK